MPKQMSTYEFIKKAKKVHGDIFDYSKVNYINYNKKITIICSIHGEFLQTPHGHLSKRGCKKCSFKIIGLKKQNTTNQFVKKSQEIHNNKYNYSKVKYINHKAKVIIICPEHGEFPQIPNNHLNGSGCKKCANRLRGLRSRLSTEEFIKKAKKVHGHIYDYSKVDYNGRFVKVAIVCRKHGVFFQASGDHLSGHGCMKCSGVEKLNTEKFIKMAKKAHDNIYDYSKVNYINNKTKVIIICLEHGEFKQTSTNHIYNKNGCPGCMNRISTKEVEWLNSVEKNEEIIIEKNKYIFINNRRFFADGFYKPTNTWYEYNGYYWHGHPNYYKSSDLHPIIKITYGELYKKTLEREKIIKSAGYNLIVKWGV